MCNACSFINVAPVHTTVLKKRRMATTMHGTRTLTTRQVYAQEQIMTKEKEM